MTDQEKLLMRIGIAAVNKEVANDRIKRAESDEKRERSDLRARYLEIEARENALVRVYLHLYGTRLS